MLGLARLWHIVLLVRARLEARAVGNFRLRIALLLGFSIANVGVGALLYKLASSPGAVSTEDALFTVYSVFATILAMITEEVNSMLLDVRSGKAPLAMTGHILLLNWNQQVPFLLDQLQQVQGAAAAGHHPFAGRPLVILADAAKDDMDAAVLSFMRHHKQLEVHTRSGKPYRPEHLQRVSAATAAAVLVLHPETSDSSQSSSQGQADPSGNSSSTVSSTAAPSGEARGSSGAAALRLQSLMALASLLLGRRAPVVVQVPETSAGCMSPRLSALDELLGLAGQRMTLHQLPVHTIISSLAVQTAIQPWTATVFHNILQHGLQPHLAFTPIPTALFRAAARAAAHLPPTAAAAAAAAAAALLPGSVAYRDARTQCGADTVALGFFSSSRQQLQLNPSEGSRLEPGDSLVVLTSAKGHKLSRSWLLKALHTAAAAVLPVVGLSVKHVGNSTAAEAAAVRRVHSSFSSKPAAAPAGPAASSSISISWRDTDSAIAEYEEEVQQLLINRPSISNSCAESDAGPFAAADLGLSMQLQDLQADTSNAVDSTAHKPPWQQQQQQQLQLARRLTSSSTTSGTKPGQLPAGTSRTALVRRRVTVASTTQTAAAAAAAATAAAQEAEQEAAAEDDAEPFRSVNSVPSWMFGARQMLQQHTQAQASKRLHTSSKARQAAQGGMHRHPQQQQCKLKVLVAGYNVGEAAHDLLPLLLEFAPAGSSVVVAVAVIDDAAAEGQQQHNRQQLPEGLDWEGQLEAEEDAQHAGGAPVRHSISYRFVKVADPTSSEGLAAAGVLEADALLLAPDAAARGSPAEADAHVLGTMLEVRHLLACMKTQGQPQEEEEQHQHQQQQPVRQLGSWESRISKRIGFGRNSSIGRHKDSGTAAAADAAAEQQTQEAAATGPPGRSPQLHVVACIATTSARAVAASFFGDAASTNSSSSGSGGAVVGCCPFSYELIVHGEVESAVLLQVANQPLYASFVREVLGSAEGCELYMLTPPLFGFMANEVVKFVEVQEVGRLLRKTVLGVVAGGRVVLAPGGDWKWCVGERDKVVALASSW